VNLGDQGSTQAVGELAVRAVPSFDAFYDRYQDAWVRYAHAQTGSRDAAEQIVDALTAHMAETWPSGPSVRRHESAARHAWKVLKATVTRWLDENGTGSAFVETAVFDRVTRVLAQSRECFAAMEESLGLYSAISHLPGRQYDSIVLCHVLKYPYSTVASLLGVTESAVRSNVRHAKKQLARELGIQYTTETRHNAHHR
jgi:RNA polymerase sigma-70 factor (ECF subfamily)